VTYDDIKHARHIMRRKQTTTPPKTTTTELKPVQKSTRHEVLIDAVTLLLEKYPRQQVLDTLEYVEKVARPMEGR
jgi:hypothetical protein